MNRQPREVYGFGPALPTRSDRLVRLARIVIVSAIAGVLLALTLSH
jgi:hypothetical protein